MSVTYAGKLEVHQFPCLEDNYGYLVRDIETGFTTCIDTPEVAAIEKALKETGWKLTHIFNTHHHFDHAGGNLELKEKTDAVILGPRKDSHRIPGLDIHVGNEDKYLFGKQEVTTYDTPGHTSGHVVYHFADAGVAFVGDTLFALGCGRLFEGTPKEMWNSMQKLLEWPDETVIYCAHEYTQANADFALTVEPQNEALVERVADIRQLRAEHQPTVPTTIGLERNTNPFMRPDSANLRATLSMPDAEDVDVFAETRHRKDNF
jgi:hydroxyacylglutathione hydrolase